MTKKSTKHSPDPQAHFEFRYRLAMKEIRASISPATFKAGVAELKRCAEGGHRDAQFELGGLYKMGEGVQENRVHALVWMLRAAAQGDTDAAFQSALLIDELTPKQIELAKEWADDLRLEVP